MGSHQLGKLPCCFKSVAIFLIDVSSFLKTTIFTLESVQSPSLVEPVQSTSSSVTLEWHYNEDDLAHPAFITGYLITVQEVGSGTLPGHATSGCREKLTLLIIIAIDLFLY